MLENIEEPPPLHTRNVHMKSCSNKYVENLQENTHTEM